MSKPLSQNATPDIPKGLEFPDTAHLTQLQEHVQKLCDHFGWHSSPEKTFLLLTEEVGELAKAIRNKEKLFQEAAKNNPDKEHLVQQNLAEELADVLGYLMDIANIYQVDLGKAYINKMSANFGRVWE